METLLQIDLKPGRKIYFASDIHLGEPDQASSRIREARFLAWLGQAEQDAAAIFLVGDIFDFWFEYKNVIPKGYSRFFGSISALTDSGMPVYIFPGNHDLWIKDYFEEELGAMICWLPLVLEVANKRIFVAHGDGLGPGDKKYKLLKKVFTNPICQWLFRWLHPDIGIKIARMWSGKSRQSHSADKKIKIEDEWLVRYSKRKLETAHFDYFVFGHRHLPREYAISPVSKYINLGDWISNYTYAEFDGEELQLKRYHENNSDD